MLADKYISDVSGAGLKLLLLRQVGTNLWCFPRKILAEVAEQSRKSY